MSVIGHSIQNSIANVHAALKDQAAAQAAQADEDARRRVRLAREEQEAREAVRGTQEGERPAPRPSGEEARVKGVRRRSEVQRRARRDEEETGQGDDSVDRQGGHIDLLA